MIKAGRVFHGPVFLCASQHVLGCFFQMCCRQLLYYQCFFLGGGTCVCITVCQVLIPSGFLPHSWRSGSCWQAGIRWACVHVLADLSVSAWGESWREPHTLWLCKEALITTVGIGLTYVTHWRDMNSPNCLSWPGMRQEKILYMLLNSSVLSLRHPLQNLRTSQTYL